MQRIVLSLILGSLLPLLVNLFGGGVCFVFRKISRWTWLMTFGFLTRASVAVWYGIMNILLQRQSASVAWIGSLMFASSILSLTSSVMVVVGLALTLSHMANQIREFRRWQSAHAETRTKSE